MRCASLALATAWTSTYLLLSGMVISLSRSTESIVMRPQGSSDLWAPWLDLIDTGVPAFGSMQSPARFALFRKRPS